MSLLTKNTILISLIFVILGIFTFHWFFIDKNMSINDCLSSNICVYTASQTVTPEIRDILRIALLVVLFIVFLPLTKLLIDKFKRIPGRMFLKWKIDEFCRKLISWLKILEKRDPQTAGYPLGLAARISDF